MDPGSSSGSRAHAGTIVAHSEGCGGYAQPARSIHKLKHARTDRWEILTALWCDFSKSHLFSKPLGLKEASRRSTNSIFRLVDAGQNLDNWDRTPIGGVKKCTIFLCEKNLDVLQLCL
jgi:hypothetical protein